MTRYSASQQISGGASSELVGADDTVTFSLTSVAGRSVTVVMTPTEAVRHRDDTSMAIIASGRTAAELSADILANSIRIAFMRLVELDKTSPVEVDRIILMMMAHLRSWKPQLLLLTEAP